MAVNDDFDLGAYLSHSVYWNTKAFSQLGTFLKALRVPLESQREVKLFIALCNMGEGNNQRMLEVISQIGFQDVSDDGPSLASTAQDKPIMATITPSLPVGNQKDIEELERMFSLEYAKKEQEELGKYAPKKDGEAVADNGWYKRYFGNQGQLSEGNGPTSTDGPQVKPG